MCGHKTIGSHLKGFGKGPKPDASNPLSRENRVELKGKFYIIMDEMILKRRDEAVAGTCPNQDFKANVCFRGRELWGLKLQSLPAAPTRVYAGQKKCTLLSSCHCEYQRRHLAQKPKTWHKLPR